MDPLTAILAKMEAPLRFAAGDDPDRISRLKNLERVMTALVREFQAALLGDPPVPDREELSAAAGALLDLFDGYDTLPAAEKKERVAEAIRRFERIRSRIHPALPCGEAGAAMPAAPTEGVAPDSLAQPVQRLRGVGPRIAVLLEKKGILTIEDLLYYLPRRYEDRRRVLSIPDTAPGLRQTVVGRVANAEMRFYGRRRIFEVLFDDGRGILKAKWFKGREAFLFATFKPGRRFILTGEVAGTPFEKEMIHPDFERLFDDEDQLLHFKRIVPVYSETEGLHQKTLRRILWQVVRDFSPLVRSPIPEEVCRRRELMGIGEAIRRIHFPPSDQEVGPYQEARSDAHRRLIYDEFFFFQLGMALRKRGEGIEEGISFRTGGELSRRFRERLPFSLTPAQRRVIGEIEADMASPRRMNRLLQGDVGSGKTAVAMAAMVIAAENGYQSAIMAPTELLAEQHYRNLKRWTDPLGLRIELLTGHLRAAERKELQTELLQGETAIAVGTHALIQEGVVFRRLGLAVIDEQHRFGVVQRAALRRKGAIPDVLVMTATPIPRTLSMTVYGDLDVSVIDEMPPGKQPVRTKVFSESQRSRVYEIIRREVLKGNQVFIVYPLVEESENLDLKDATRMARHLQQEIFPDFRIGLVHGRMKEAEKNGAMADFVDGKLQILVSTTVIEVGIDIPDASLMVIEHAERFGLSQLHQLRGRVGRSDIPSFCILLAQFNRSEEARKRLRIMEETTDGFRIAEEDLAIRGPGEFLGTRQSGLPDFRVASILRDGRILGEARRDAFALVEEDPRLETADHLPLREVLVRRWGGRLELAKTG